MLVAPSDNRHWSSSQRDLHDVLGKVARRVRHLLMRGRDREAGRVVVRAEMCPGHASAAGSDEIRERDATIG